MNGTPNSRWWFNGNDFHLGAVSKIVYRFSKEFPWLSIGKAKVFDITNVEDQITMIDNGLFKDSIKSITEFVENRYQSKDIQYGVCAPNLATISEMEKLISLPIRRYDGHIKMMEGFPTFENMLILTSKEIIHCFRSHPKVWWKVSTWEKTGDWSKTLCWANESNKTLEFDPINTICVSPGISYHKDAYNIDRHVGLSTGFRTCMILWSLLNNRKKIKLPMSPNFDESDPKKIRNIVVGDISRTVYIHLNKEPNGGRTMVRTSRSTGPTRRHIVPRHQKKINGEIRWIEAYERGDASLGWSTPRYIVKQ